MATTLDEARGRIGNGVLYRPRGGGIDSTEEGTITSVNESYVFVRFGSSRTSAACDPDDLTLLAAPDVTERRRAFRASLRAAPIDLAQATRSSLVAAEPTSP
jgi:hypothetical protein